MGNHHHTGRQLWANQWSHHCILRGALRGFHYSLQDSSDTESEPEENSCSGNATSERLQEAVLNNDVQVLKDLINNNEVDLNMPMNSKEETALMMSVKLSHLDMVQTLLTFPNCNNNAFNSHHFSVLDAALIALFDRKDSPQSELCWQILVTLIKAKSEPLSKDAMIYVIRTALKNQDTDFISRLIDTVTAESDSPVLHQFLLEKLHRHQPIYPESMDPILEQMTHFTVSLLRGSSILTLRQVVPDMEFYLESYWRSREKKERVVTQLVVYATAAGSNWTEHEIVAIGRVIPSLARWCCRCKHVPMSLSHSSRLAFRSSVSHSVTQSISALPQHVPKLLKNYLLLHDLDSLPHNIFDLYL